MGKQYSAISKENVDFIGAQKMFFLASSSGKEVSLSPKGYDCFRVLDERTALYMDYPGSGNRLARDISEGGEVTVMFCSFAGEPKTLRLFCDGELVEKADQRFGGLMSGHFGNADPETVRRLALLKVYSVEVSCGESVPLFDYIGDRDRLRDWAVKMSSEGKLSAYMESHAVPKRLR
jgi:hypothetical protein